MSFDKSTLPPFSVYHSIVSEGKNMAMGLLCFCEKKNTCLRNAEFSGRVCDCVCQEEPSSQHHHKAKVFLFNELKMNLGPILPKLQMA